MKKLFLLEIMILIYTNHFKKEVREMTFYYIIHETKHETDAKTYVLFSKNRTFLYKKHT